MVTVVIFTRCNWITQLCGWSGIRHHRPNSHPSPQLWAIYHDPSNCIMHGGSLADGHCPGYRKDLEGSTGILCQVDDGGWHMTALVAPEHIKWKPIVHCVPEEVHDARDKLNCAHDQVHCTYLEPRNSEHFVGSKFSNEKSKIKW